MVDIHFKTNIDAFERTLRDDQKRHLPFALARALTWTAKGAKRSVERHMQVVFDQPTPYTMRALRFKPAFKREKPIHSAVLFRDFAGKGTPARKYLRPHIDGGRRRQKRSERALQRFMGNRGYWVPGAGLKLNRYGNVPGSTITRILSRLGASSDGYQNQTERSKTRKSNRAKQYFVSPPGGHLKAGVYERTSSGVKPILIFVHKVRYRKRFRFDETVHAHAERHFDRHFARSFALALKTAKPK